MNKYEAAALVLDGKCDEGAYAEAMQVLIDTAHLWNLPYQYGAMAFELVSIGVCQKPSYVEEINNA